MKRLITATFYVAYYHPKFQSVSAALQALGVRYTTKDVLCGFYGIQFSVEAASGKGSRKINDAIYSILGI